MWPNMEIEMMMGKLDAIRDIIRIAYGAEGENRVRLFETARSMLGELADVMRAKAPEMEDEDE